MTVEHHRGRPGGLLGLAIVCAGVVALAAFGVMRSRQSRAVVIKVDANGTPRLGPVSLGNTNVRDAAFSVVGRLSSGTVAVSAANSARFRDIVSTFDAMKQAGITSLHSTPQVPTNDDAARPWMINPAHIVRFNAAWSSKSPADALGILAVSLRDEGVSQIDIYLLFEHFQLAADGDDKRHDAIADTMDLIYGGPWAKGHGLFPTELTEEAIRRYKGLPPAEQ